MMNILLHTDERVIIKVIRIILVKKYGKKVNNSFGHYFVTVEKFTHLVGMKQIEGMSISRSMRNQLFYSLLEMTYTEFLVY